MPEKPRKNANARTILDINDSIVIRLNFDNVVNNPAPRNVSKRLVF
jgi:hypothetical protein